MNTGKVNKMYEQPEYIEGKEYWFILDTPDSSFYRNHSFAYNRSWYDRLKREFNLFATRELAQHAADKKNAELKLLRLAQEREKEFPIDLIDNTKYVYYYEFFINEIGNFEFSPRSAPISEVSNQIYFSFKDYIESEKWLESNFTQSEIEALCRPVRYV